MSYCDTCIHHDVCGVEGVDDEATTYCADRLERCEDVISRQGTIDAMIKRFDGEKAHDQFWNCDMVMDVLRDMPSVKSQEKTGYWINTKSGQECSECHETQPGYNVYRFYCSNCGRRMVPPQKVRDKE